MIQKEYVRCAVLIVALVICSAAQAKSADLYFKSNTDNSYWAKHTDDGKCMDDNPMDNISFKGNRAWAVTHIYYSSSIFYCGWHQSWFDFVVSDAQGHKAKIRWYKRAGGYLPFLWIRSDPNHLIKNWNSEYHDNDISRGGYYSTTIALNY
ncbi:hypothetical protein [Endozoicomonas sp. 2B-B]